MGICLNLSISLHRATYEILEDDRSFYGVVSMAQFLWRSFYSDPELPGVYTTVETLEG
jgi:hypothetical protein